MTETKNRPEKKFKAGAITATIWNAKDGKALLTVFEKRYKDASDEWVTTTHFTAADLATLAWLARECFAHITARGS